MKNTEQEIKKIGNKLRRSRKSKRFTQEEMANAIGVTHTTISRYEKGEIDIPVSSLIQIGRKCDYEPKNYLDWEADPYKTLYEMIENGNAKTVKIKATKNDMINLSDKAVDYIMAYKTISACSGVSEEQLQPLKEKIIDYIEIETGCNAEDMARRLTAYVRGLAKISKNKEQ